MNKFGSLCGFVLVVGLLSVLASDADKDAGYNIPGGRFSITEEKELKDLEQKVVTHFKKLSESDNGANLEFVRVKSAEYQVVAGMIWRLVAEINENKALTDCSIEIYEKPWLDFVKLDVECGDEKRKYKYQSGANPDDAINAPKGPTAALTRIG